MMDHPRCTMRDHFVPAYFTADEKMYRCECGLVMIGNGKATIRFGLLTKLWQAKRKAGEKP